MAETIQSVAFAAAKAVGDAWGTALAPVRPNIRRLEAESNAKNFWVELVLDEGDLSSPIAALTRRHIQPACGCLVSSLPPGSVFCELDLPSDPNVRAAKVSHDGISVRVIFAWRSLTLCDEDGHPYEGAPEPVLRIECLVVQA
jgi:hypothetical protein